MLPISPACSATVRPRRAHIMARAIAGVLAIVVVAVVVPAARAQDDVPADDSTEMPQTHAGPARDSMAWDVSTMAVSSLRRDSGDVVVRRPPASAVARFRDDRAFRYDREAQQTQSLVDRIMRWFFHSLDEVVGSQNGGRAWKVISWALMAFAVLFVAWKLYGSNIRGLFTRAPSGVGAFEEVAEDVRTMDFDAMIAEAVAAHAYRRAVRLLYLSQIRAMSDRGMIAWRVDKTNHEYEHEIASYELRRAFAGITLLFEYVWYGDFPVDEGTFGSMRSRFAEFAERLGGPR